MSAIKEKKTLLIIDDEPDIREILQYNLEKEGFDVKTAPNGIEGIALAKEITPHLILLDVMMPEMDGIEVCERIRSISDLEHTLICFLTARNEDYSQIAGLEAGADDYIAKPIKPRVLVSKIKALLRRQNGRNEQSNKKSNDLIIDRETFIVYLKGDELHLPKKEFELLALLVSKPGKVFDRDEILNKVWGNEIVVGDRTIDVHIRKLREKIGASSIKTIKGVGYKFEGMS